MKIFVTGGSGFIGSNFILSQIKNHNNIILNYDKITYAANIDNLKEVESNSLYSFVNGDIQDYKKLKNVLTNFLLTISLILQLNLMLIDQ